MYIGKPCPLSKHVSWPPALVESCLVHTVDLISPKAEEQIDTLRRDASAPPPYHAFLIILQIADMTT